MKRFLIFFFVLLSFTNVYGRAIEDYDSQTTSGISSGDLLLSVDVSEANPADKYKNLEMGDLQQFLVGKNIIPIGRYSGDLDAAVAALDVVGNAGESFTIVIDQATTMSADVDLRPSELGNAASITLAFLSPAGVIATGGNTLTIANQIPLSVDWQIFSAGTDEVAFSSAVTALNAVWWGSDTAAWQQAIDASYNVDTSGTPALRPEIVFTPGTYTTTGLKVYPYQTIVFMRGAKLSLSSAATYGIQTLNDTSATVPTASLRKIRIVDPVIDMNGYGNAGIFLNCAWEAEVLNPYIIDVPAGTFSYNDGEETASYEKSGIIFKSRDGSGTTAGCYYNYVHRPQIYGQYSSINISGITQASPCQITTSSAHGLSTGQYIYLDSSAVAGMTEIRSGAGVYQVTVVDTTNFTVAIDASGYSAYTSGGSIKTFEGNVGILFTSSPSGASIRTNLNTVFMPQIRYFSKGIMLTSQANDNFINMPSQMQYVGVGMDIDGNRTTVIKPYIEVCSIGIDTDDSRYSEILGIGSIAATSVAWQNTDTTNAPLNTWWGSYAGLTFQPYAPTTMGAASGGILGGAVQVRGTGSGPMYFQTKDSASAWKNRAFITNGTDYGLLSLDVDTSWGDPGYDYTTMLKLGRLGITLADVESGHAASSTYRGLKGRIHAGAGASDGEVSCLKDSGGDYSWVKWVPVFTKTDTGDPAAHFGEGSICINTFDNTAKIYADGGWRTIASGW